ncbi:MAG TPA: hypothetical protein DER05_02080 [Lutibacter sp.]|nr:hypothetical protein [Lutibacter sp.]
MIKICRDKFPPIDLFQVGVNRGFSKWRIYENTVINDFRKNSDQFINGDYNFRRHPSYDIWKNEIIKNQGRKCCYCEKPIANGTLDHYRPKNGWQQNLGDPISKPGYYWLAYRWLNLLLTCGECNDQSQKGNLFPIGNVRATNQLSRLNDELATLINPYEEDPTQFISFYKSDPFSKHARGYETIKILKLKDRPDISEARKDNYSNYKMAMKIAQLPSPYNIISQEDIDEAKERIRVKIKSKEPFSGMILENIKNDSFD